MRPPEQFFDRYPHQLSGGQQQRVVIAGALALDPDVIVADEPVSSLDASVRGEILKLFLALRDDLGLSALVVSHDLGLAWNIADRVAVMYLGRIVEVGTVDEVLLHPQHPYTRGADRGRARRRSATPPWRPCPASRPTRPGSRSGCRFHPRCPLRTRWTGRRPTRAMPRRRATASVRCRPSTGSLPPRRATRPMLPLDEVNG